MKNINAIGIDLAKNIFQICAVDNKHRMIFNRQVKRSAVLSSLRDIEPTIVAIEACASSHYWAEQIEALGHRVRLIPTQHVKAFLRGHKHDANDAAALAEAATREDLPESVRKTPWQRQLQLLIRRRERRVRNRTQLINQLRGMLYEHGITIGSSVATLKRRLPQVMLELEQQDPALLAMAVDLIDELKELQQRIDCDGKQLKRQAQANPICCRLMDIPGVGYLNAVSLVAAVGVDSTLRNGRQMAAWLGLTPRMHGTGGRIRHGSITHRGNASMRTLLVHGARSAMNAKYDDPLVLWAKELAKRSGHNKAVVALANRLARIAWVIIHRHEHYQPGHRSVVAAATP